MKTIIKRLRKCSITGEYDYVGPDGLTKAEKENHDAIYSNFVKFMYITYKQRRIAVEQIKTAKAEGYSFYLFRDLDARSKFVGKYIVAVKNRSETLHFVRYFDIANAVFYYHEMLCRYA